MLLQKKIGSLKALPFDYMLHRVQKGSERSLNVWSVESSNLDFQSW
jgi:hypothetical protein